MRLKFKDYFVTIGLEIHVALTTQKKLFSSTENSFSCSTFSLLDCAIPGVLPTFNPEALELACVFGFATKSKINLYSEFERKHYFYPDLSLGYQITQQHKPILGHGIVPITINGTKKDIHIEHSHLECDAAKSIHDMFNEYTAIDVSRGGSVLLEIVSTPCLHSPAEAKEYAKTIHSLVKTLDICDGKMEEGSFRVDASISLCKDENILGTRVELKNISSFSFLETALFYEIERQSELLNKGLKILMQTRLFNEKTEETVAMRDKETVQDYRFMQDPDIPAIELTTHYLEEVENKHFVQYFDLIDFYTRELSDNNIEKEKIIELLKTPIKTYLIDLFRQQKLFPVKKEKIIKAIFFWIPEIITKTKGSDFTLIPLIELIKLLDSNIESKEFKDIYILWLTNKQVAISSLIPKQNPEDKQLINTIIQQILNSFKEQIEDEKLPLEKKTQFIMGQCMKQLKGKIPASQLFEEIKKHIS